MKTHKFNHFLVIPGIAALSSPELCMDFTARNRKLLLLAKMITGTIEGAIIH